MKNMKNSREKNLNLILVAIIAVVAVSLIMLSMSGCIGPKTETPPENETTGQEQEPEEPAANETPEEQPIPSDEAVKAGDTVMVDYVGKLENGSIFDESEPGSPLKFTVGTGQMILGFDEAVVGMKIGDKKTVTLPPEKAYGMPKTAPLIQTLTVEQFIRAMGKEPVLDMEFNVSGVFWQIKVVAIENETVTIKHQPEPDTEYNPQLKVFEVTEDEMTYGHSLTGKTLVFEITLANIADECEAMGIVKSDKPKVNIFVMSYCPYGTQIEKGIIPVRELLGSKADININFVHYLMHGTKEGDENTVQYCIQKEQEDKFWAYLACFLEKGDSIDCLDRAKIDKDKLAGCLDDADKTYNISAYVNDKSTWLNGQFPVYKVHEDLAKKYGIGGSPGVVINDNMIQTNRDPESLKKAICCAFNKKPAECNQALSTTPPSPGFGFTGTGGSEGSCG